MIFYHLNWRIKLNWFKKLENQIEQKKLNDQIESKKLNDQIESKNLMTKKINLTFTFVSGKNSNHNIPLFFFSLIIKSIL